MMSSEPLAKEDCVSSASFGWLTPSTSELSGCGYSSMVEPQPSKLKTRVRFPLPAPS